MQKIRILKPFQSSGVWFAVGQVTSVPELRAKDLIEAGLAEEAPTDAPQAKPRIATQAKPRQAASTKAIAVVEPIKPADNNTGNPQGDSGADLVGKNTDQQTGGDNTGDQQDPIGTTGDNTTNNTNDQG